MSVGSRFEISDRVPDDPTKDYNRVSQSLSDSNIKYETLVRYSKILLSGSHLVSVVQFANPHSNLSFFSMIIRPDYRVNVQFSY
jgi:hypothetical protein